MCDFAVRFPPRQSLAVVGTVSIALLLAACDPTPSTGLGLSVANTGDNQLAGVTARQFATDREELLEVSRTLGGFAGVYDDGDTVVVNMTSAAALAAVTMAPKLRSFLGARGLTNRPIRLRQVRNDYQSLYTTFRRVADGFRSADLSLLEISDRHNRLRVGVARVGAVHSTEKSLHEMGIDTSLVDVWVSGAVVPSTTLQQPFYLSSYDGNRYRTGGLQIQFSKSGVTQTCTLGFNAAIAFYAGFVTNSHCSQQSASTHNTAFYQSDLQDSAHLIGYEWLDPVYFSGGVCPSGAQCRYSDALFAVYTDDQRGARGKVARTVYGTTDQPGTIEINDEDSVYTFVSTGTMTSGWVEKVGRTTGHTGGPITSACSDVYIPSTNVWILCQSLATAYVDGGDSGSPVFAMVSASSAKLVGLLWAQLNVTPRQFVFSRFSYIQDELGTMTYVTSP